MKKCEQTCSKKVHYLKKLIDIAMHEHVKKFTMRMKISIIERAKLVTMFIAMKKCEQICSKKFMNIIMCDGDEDQYSRTCTACDHVHSYEKM